MHDFIFSKQNTYSFQKGFDFLIFQKIENLGMLQIRLAKIIFLVIQKNMQCDKKMHDDMMIQKNKKKKF